MQTIHKYRFEGRLPGHMPLHVMKNCFPNAEVDQISKSVTIYNKGYYIDLYSEYDHIKVFIMITSTQPPFIEYCEDLVNSVLGVPVKLQFMGTNAYLRKHRRRIATVDPSRFGQCKF